jgi:hypothetical protein
MSEGKDFGVCRLSIVPVYDQPDYSSRQYNQLLFGEHYTVTGVKGDWVSIQLAFDDSGGWISKSQHYSISPEYFEQICNSDYKITTDLAATILYNKIPVHIVMGSVVPISNSELFKMEEQLAFNGESKSLSLKRDAEFLKSVLLKYGIAPYLPGGKTPFGIDSSGLVQMGFKICGYKVPRSTAEQIHSGKPVADFNEALPGDIIVLKKSDKEMISSILIASDKVLLVDSQARQELIDATGIKAIGQKKYSWEIVEIRRIIN